MPEAKRPNVVLTSPYLRARQTVAGIRDAGGVAAETPDNAVDERLREKELGLLDRLTRRGIEELYPEQAELRTRLGKFYYRPICGESWCDVILRLRGAMDTVSCIMARSACSSLPIRSSCSACATSWRT